GQPPVRFNADALIPGKVPYASPAVRLFARELGVDLSQVSGSAKAGRITREDVQKYVKGALAGGGAPRAAAAGGGGGLDLLPWPKVDFSKFGEVEEKPLSRIKKISGANLARNWAMIPHVTQHDDADITELEDVQKYVKGALAGGGAPRAAAAGGGGGLDLLPWPKVDFSKFGEVEEKPLSRIKKISGANLARNWAMIPHVTQHDDADITELE